VESSAYPGDLLTDPFVYLASVLSKIIAIRTED
jgi:hypothetical protein